MLTLRRQLIGTLLLLGGIPLALFLLLNIFVTQQGLLKSKHSELRNFGTEVKRQISTTLTSIRLGMEAISSNPTLRDEKADTATKLLEFERLSNYTHFCTYLSLLKPDGFILQTTNRTSLLGRDGTDWLAECVRRGTTVISRPELDSQQIEENEPIVLWIHIYQPIKDKTGRVVNVVRADMTFDQIWAILRDARVGETGSFVLLDNFGNTLYHPNRDLILKNYVKEFGVDFMNLMGGEYRIGSDEFLFESDRLSKIETYTDRTWILITQVRKSEAMALATQNRWTTIGVAGFSLALTALVGTWLASRIARPVSEACAAARAVAAGALHTRIKGEGARELVELAEAFNHMTFQVLQHKEELDLIVSSRTKRLRESQANLSDLTAQLRSAYDSTREGILVVHREGRIVAANRKLEELFGLSREEIQNFKPYELQDLLRSRFEADTTFSLINPDGSVDSANTEETEWQLVTPKARSISIYTAPVLNQEGVFIARLWMFHDTTAHRLLEDSLRHSQKMEAVGRLAGGVAHDFNNLLQGILGNLFIIQNDPDLAAKDDIRRCIHAARNAGLRAAELIRGLLGFSRQSHLKLGHCRVNNVLQDLRDLVKHSFDPRVTIILDLTDNIWGLHADSTQLEQVFMNMVVNAKDAMPNGGELRLTTRNVQLQQGSPELSNAAVPGDFVRISISDQGSGMSPEIRKRIFEPFFTTKEQGKGTGLGLATSFGIIEQHDGWITVDSTAGKGTRFDIYLPRNEPSAELEIPETVSDTSKPKGGKETILVVDDELVVRSVAEAILRKNGYQVLSAADGMEALDMLARHDGSIDLVLMDMTMPRLNGMDTFHHMRKGQAPNIPVVICSGYLVDLAGFTEATGSTPNGFLQKPYAIDDMTRTVRRVLDEVAAAKA